MLVEMVMACWGASMLWKTARRVNVSAICAIGWMIPESIDGEHSIGPEMRGSILSTAIL